MRFFTSDDFLSVSVDALQAADHAALADRKLDKASIVLYGKYEDGKYFDFTSWQKKSDTHVILAYAQKKLRGPNGSVR